MNSGKIAHGWIVLLGVAWLLPGLVGHDPWKPDEAYTMGLVYHILETGDWIIPTLANEPFMEKPPLYFLTAAWTASQFSTLLPLHDGARLSSGFYMGLVFTFTAFTGYILYGKGHGRISMLLLMGSLGLLPYAHFMITDTSLLAGFSIAFCGLALSRQKPWIGGILLGMGAGMGFMSKGLLAPLVLGAVVCSLLLLSAAWRIRNVGISLAVAVVVSLPWLGLWPYLLYQRSPEQFDVWLWENNFGRFFGFSTLATHQEQGYYIKALSWFALPVLPLTLKTLWLHRGRGWQIFLPFGTPELLLPLVMGGIILLVLMVSSATRELYILPLLLPLAILATPAITQSNSTPHPLFGQLIRHILGGLVLLVWLIWLLAISHIPLGTWIAAILPDEFFIMQEKEGIPFQWLAFSLALFSTLLWFFWISFWKKFPENLSAQHLLLDWTSGVTLLWLLFMTLCLPVIDYGKSYQSMINSMSEKLPASYTCMASQRLGEPQRAMLHYFGHIITHRLETGFPENHCDLLLVSMDPKHKPSPPADYQRLWEGGRPGDKKEWYILYQRHLHHVD